MGIYVKYVNHSRDIISTKSPVKTAAQYDVAQDFTLRAVRISTAVVGSQPSNPDARLAIAVPNVSFC